MAQRQFDIILYGATGYTGKLALEYFARTKRDLATFAIAGRNLAKLKAEAQAAGLPADGTNFIVADASSAESLRAMAARGRAVVAMVGPFSLYGMPLVHACIAARTHYVDITGEFNFVADVAQLNDQAREAGIYLVCCAGFDCVPSDLVNYQVNRRAAALSSGTVKYVQGLFKAQGGASRGTLTTMAGLLPHLRLSDFKPLSLLTQGQQSALSQDAVAPYYGFPRISLPAFCKPSNTYVAPFLMAGMNEKIARKTSALLGFRASYVEGTYGSFVQALVHFCLATFGPILLMLPVVKSIIAYLFFPAANAGPDAAARAKGKTTVVARGFDADPMKAPNAKELVRVTMRIPIDAYTFTAISAIETAQAIVDGELTAEAKEPGRFWSGGGAVTPAAVVGESLTRRLEKAGMKFE